MSDGDIFEVPEKKDTNWALCCLCQGQSKKDLRCPYKKECHHAAYQTLEYDLQHFVDNDMPLPFGVNLACIAMVQESPVHC